MVFRVAISLNEGTLSLFESMEKPTCRLMVRESTPISRPAAAPLIDHHAHVSSPLAPLLLLLQADAACTVVVRPHSWTLDTALGAAEVLDLDPLTKYRTVVTRKLRKTSTAYIGK